MDTFWQKLRFLRSKRLKRGIGKAGRVAASLGMVFALFGPNPYTPIGQPVRTAEAKNLEWGDVRGILTEEGDSTDANGFTHLPDYGRALHALTAAPNGDIFTGGTGADVNADGTGDCSGAVDANVGAATCDAAAAVAPVIFRSTDGGMKWRSARIAGAAVGTTVRQIVVSPDYPSDNFVAVVFTTLTAADAATAANGVCWSSDGGLTFAATACRTGAGFATDPDLDDVLWTTIALSPDFNFNDSAGEVAVGGTAAGAATGPTTATASVTALKAALATGTFNDILEGTATDSAADRTLHLTYTYDEEPIALARLYVNDGVGTYGQVRGSGGWAATAGITSESIMDDDSLQFSATSGNVAFDDDYATGGSFFAAVGNPAVAGAGGVGTAGGVFRFSGSTWNEKTTSRRDCDDATDWVTVAGNGSATKLVSSINPGVARSRVCRSTNEGSSWSDNQADGGDSVCNQCQVEAAGVTRISNNRSTPQNVYYTHSGARGGLMKSMSTGSSWMDTGLTNEAYVASAPDEVSATRAFALATVPTGQVGAALDAIFHTDTYGTGAGWQRVLRYDSTDLALVLPGDFATAGVVWAYRNLATTDPVLRSTDGGRTFDETSADPFENSPESNELPKTSSGRSGTTLYLGGDKGHVSYTTDGGATWTLLAMDFGEDIDEFDFTSDPKIFFVTGEGTDNTNKVWQTKDSGATFTQVGNAPWGTGDGVISTLITGYKPADNTGYLLVVTASGTSTQDVFRIKMGDAIWEELDIDTTEWDSHLTTAAAGQGDGVMLTLWDNDGGVANPLQITFSSFSTPKDDFDDAQGAGNERDNPLLVLPPPPVTTGTMSSNTRYAAGYTLQTAGGGRIMELTLTTAYRTGITVSTPPDNTSVPTNVGDNGVPAIFRWNSVDRADEYQMMIGLDAKLTDGTLLAAVTTNLQIVSASTGAMFPLIQGNTYYWAVRVTSTDNVASGGLEGPWSKIARFSVASGGAPATPEPQLPLDNTTTPNVGPIQFSFNLPAGTVQYQIQITPLNNDGPAINLIIGDPAIVSSGSFTALPPVLGQGNYVLLAGATYTWRIRATGKTGAIAETDSSWGPWSSIRIFKTPRPSSVTMSLQVVGTNNVTTDTTPTLSWKDSNVSNFYYEVQVSGDPMFNQDPGTATSFVYHNLVHGGISNPLNTWTVPDANALAKGRYYWRARQRVQATPLGPDEPGVGWSAAKTFTVQ